ncbi:glycoside hydrolase family 10 protein [Limnofasciculus baicalensis]|uniref:Family 10 glycosylhydrolase n=1 Tax=Limnofasciculus baicalensis BBK-W-15 TaxID=2699891 RepID=A0AAE3GNS1_9CYAN|nr:glycoside hydrolase family 10 protein [Limnofasciculus baicalensis]MCP2727961.1 family 10 glycosylhydrolase [Limnofasciculus baicalensis BBK-W-15]
MNRKNQGWLNFLLCLIIAVNLVLFDHPKATPSMDIANSQTPEALTEIRGVWLTNVASGILFFPWGINRAVYQLAQLNFNTIYPVVWNRGHTFYPSTVAKSVTGEEQDPVLNIIRLGRDVLAEIIQEGHNQGLRIIPWFEYGFMAPPNSKLAKNHPNWITKSSSLCVKKPGIVKQVQTKPGQNQNKLSSQCPIPTLADPDSLQNSTRKLVWLNPLHPEVQKFILNLIVEVVKNYDIDGIQLDDHFGMPVELGYDDFTIKLYQKEHKGKLPPNNPLESEWMEWRANKISQFLEKIYKRVKSIKPDCLISVSPNSQAFSYNNYLQDWLTWVERGWVDELVLQAYRNDMGGFQAELNKPAVQIALKKIPVSIGITTGTGKRPVAMKQIQQQVKEVRDRNFNGVSFFYWETLWSYLTPESPKQRRQGFLELFSEKSPLG